MQFILILAAVLFFTGGFAPGGALAGGPDFKKLSEAIQKSKEELRENLTAAVAKGRAGNQSQHVAKEMLNDAPAALPARAHHPKKSTGFVCISENGKVPC